MKCQNMFSGRNKKNIINLSSAEFLPRALSARATNITVADDILIFFFFLIIFQRK